MINTLTDVVVNHNTSSQAMNIDYLHKIIVIWCYKKCYPDKFVKVRCHTVVQNSEWTCALLSK